MRLRRLVARARVRLPADDGISIVELAVAMLILAVAVIGVLGSMGSSLSLVGESRQRSSATAIAQERLERAHNVPYTRLALDSQPVYSSDPTNPDNALTTDGTSYNVNSTPEPVVVDTTNGAIKHIDDPVQVGATQFSIYQYVTWHDDPQIPSTQCPTGTGTYCDYKRVVVVVIWKFPVHAGVGHSVTESTFIGPGGVVVPAATAAPTASPSPSPSPSPTPSPTPTPTSAPTACGTMQLLSGTGAQQGYTNSTNVQVQLTSSNGCTSVALSNDGTHFTSVATSFPATVTWSVPAGDGTKTVYAQFVTNGSSTVTGSSTIVLDQTKPTQPTGLVTSSCSISSQTNTRTATVTWNASSDAHLVGYRLYKQTNSGAFAQVTTTTALYATDTSSKADAVGYYVTAYDAAGNESPASSTLNYKKNGC